MKVMTKKEFREFLMLGWDSAEAVTYECPKCKTLQSAKDLIEAGAGNSYESVQKYVGRSCVGRFSKDRGCNWSLDGLFQIHELEVIGSDGERYPFFMPKPAEVAESNQR